MTSGFAGEGTFTSAVLDASQGNALISIAGGLGEKAVAELRTPQGVKRAQSSPEKVEQRLRFLPTKPQDGVKLVLRPEGWIGQPPSAASAVRSIAENEVPLAMVTASAMAIHTPHGSGRS